MNLVQSSNDATHWVTIKAKLEDVTNLSSMLYNWNDESRLGPSGAAGSFCAGIS